jgi:regulatory protein
VTSAHPDPVDLAARALRHRERSRREIDERLAKAGVDEVARADAIETLERVGYLDDARFAAARAAALAARGYGDAFIRHDLGGRGLDGATVGEALGALEPEADRARALAARLGPGARTAARLARKGFAGESIESALGGEIPVDPIAALDADE